MDDLKDYYIFEVKDNAMHPTLQPGDTLFFVLGAWEPKQGEVMVLKNGDTYMARRYIRKGGRGVFIGDNPDTPHIELHDINGRIGKVLEARRPLRLASPAS